MVASADPARSSGAGMAMMTRSVCSTSVHPWHGPVTLGEWLYSWGGMSVLEDITASPTTLRRC